MALRQVRIDTGLVEGLPGGNTAVSVFKGIPFAEPPVGPLRWKAPQPIKPWEGVYKAYKFMPIAAQAIEDHTFYSKEFYKCREPMSEDALYLNVWTPAVSAEEKLPVMMYIHGGGFNSGYSYEMEFDGEGFAKRGVILVTIAYRLGALGFLAHPELTAEGGEKKSGNYGMLDQIAALEWIRRNIAAFGGDPEKITNFGESAGGMSVCNLITTDMTKGMIAGAIMMSGGGYTGDKILPACSLEQAEQLGVRLLQELGVSTIDEARKLPFEKITAAQKKVGSRPLVFRPFVDGYVHQASPAEVIAQNKQHQIPYMVGHTSFENGSYAFVPEFDATPESMKEEAETKYGKYAERFLRAAGYYEDPNQAILHGGLDDMMPPAMCAFARLQAERGIPTYYYRFNRHCPGDNCGAYHASESWFVFQTINRCWRPFTGVDYELSNDCCSYFANFAKAGDPNGEGLPEWIPFTKEENGTMDLGVERRMIVKPLTERQEFITDFILDRLD